MKKQDYARIWNAGDRYSEYFSVSTVDLRNEKFAFYLENENRAGNWGLVNRDFNEIIEPKYLFPLNFNYSYPRYLSVATKGKWRYDDKWKHNLKSYAGYWTDEEKWGVIDLQENEVIPFEYDEIREIRNNDDAARLVGYAVWKEEKKKWKMALFNNNGEQLTDFVYCDCDYDSQSGLLLVSKGDELWGEDGKTGIFDFNKGEFLIDTKYNYIDIVDDENLIFYASEDNEGDNGFLVNRYGNKIGPTIWETDPSTLGIFIGGHYESLPSGVYHGKMKELNMEHYFRIIDNGNRIQPIRLFSSVFISKKNDLVDGTVLNKKRGESVAWIVDECGKLKNDITHFGAINYFFVKTNFDGKDVIKGHHCIDGYVYEIAACYRATKEDGLKVIGSYERRVNYIGDGKAEDDNGMPLIGWRVVLADINIDRTKFSWRFGCDDMTMNILHTQKKNGVSSVEDLGAFPVNLGELFDFIEFGSMADKYQIDNDPEKAIPIPLIEQLPLLKTVDWYGKTTLPCDVTSEFRIVEKYAKVSSNNSVAKMAHDAIVFIEERQKKVHPDNCSVLFGGM